VSAVLNLYWDLVTFYQDLKARKDELSTAQALFEDNKKQVAIGSLSRIEITRAEAEVSARQEELLISQTNVAQQETILKNALSRTGAVSAALDEVHIVPLDRIEIPALGQAYEGRGDALQVETAPVRVSSLITPSATGDSA